MYQNKQTLASAITADHHNREILKRNLWGKNDHTLFTDHIHQWYSQHEISVCENQML